MIDIDFNHVNILRKDQIDSRQTTLGKLNVRYFTGGKGDPLLIVHGGAGGGAKGWLPNMSELCRYFTVYLPDLPGFGLSQSISGDHGVNDFVEFIDNFARSVGLTSFYLVGHSMGGAIAMRYALKFRHKVKKLVIVDGMGVGKEIAPWVRFFSTSTLCRSVGVATFKLLRAIKWLVNTAYARVRFTNPLPLAAVLMGASLGVLMEEADSIVLRLATLMIPTLIVWGAKDRIVPVSNAYSAARLFPACEVHVFENGGHFAYSREANKFAALLADYLR